MQRIFATFYNPLHRMIQCAKGATVLEFAFIFPVFLLLFMGIMEVGFISFGNSIINNTMHQMSRKGMVGCERMEIEDGECLDQYAVTPSVIRLAIEQKSMGLVDSCNRRGDNFTLNVQPIVSLDSIDVPDSGLDLGQGGEVVVYYASYNWPVFNPFLQIRELFGGFINFEYATVVRNERFGDMGNSRVMVDVGC